MVQRSPLITPVLLAGSLVVLVGFAIRASFGVFQLPIAMEFNWPRAEFSLAIAIQNLAWGFGQPLFGAVAEKIGDRKAIVLGALAYALGLVLSAGATLPIQHQLYEVLVGLGIAGTGFGVVLAVVGRASSDENRSMSLAIVTAAGSAGQVLGPPLAEGLLALMPWQGVFLAFAALILAVLLVLPWMRSPAPASRAELQQSMGAVVLGALRDPQLRADLPGVLLLRLPARLHHGPLPGLRGRGLRADHARQRAARDGDHDDRRPGRRRDLDHRARQHRGHAGGGLGREALHQEVPAGRDLHGPHPGLGLVHPDADDADHGARVLGR